MSTTNVKYKRVGYLAACQSFGDDTDVVLLIPNLLKKDLASPNPAEAARHLVSGEHRDAGIVANLGRGRVLAVE